MHRPLLGHGRAAVLRPLSGALLMLRAGHSGHPVPMAATLWLHGEGMVTAAAVAAAPRLHHESVAAATAVTVAATASGRLHDKRVSAAVAAAATAATVAAATGSLHRRPVAAAAAVASATAVRSCTCRGCDR
jgi:hypothetical protein